MKGVFLPKLNLDSTFMPFSSGPEMENKVVGKDSVNTSDILMLKWAMSQQDRKALAALHAKYYAIIRHHIASRVDSAADAEDLAQDVFVELCKGNGQYDGQRNAEQYLLGVAANIIHKHYRKTARSPNTVPIEQIGDIPAEPMAEDGLNPAITEIVAKLPPNAHQALKLRFADGLSNQEAAKQSGCLINTFRKRVHYALEKIRLHLQDRSES